MPDCIKRLLIGSYTILFVFFMARAVSDIRKAPERAERADYMVKSTVTPTATPTPSPTATPTPVIYEEITVKVMRKESLGSYFITSYCPAECGGSWQTASGATCHRAEYENRYTEPTTCAIDRKIHSFGDLFYIEEFDRVFVAEDTGSAVKNKHLDLFYIDYSDVLSFPTGYYEVYSVYYEDITLKVRKDTEKPLIKKIITEEELDELYSIEKRDIL
jgi:3D (Asp-Asp-Asp) domain-containing protein